MLPEKLTIEDEFPPVGYDQWRALAEADLKGATARAKAGLRTRTMASTFNPFILVEMNLAPTNQLVCQASRRLCAGANSDRSVRDGWDLRQEHAHPDLKVTKPKPFWTI